MGNLTISTGQFSRTILVHQRVCWFTEAEFGLKPLAYLEAAKWLLSLNSNIVYLELVDDHLKAGL